MQGKGHLSPDRQDVHEQSVTETRQSKAAPHEDSYFSQGRKSCLRWDLNQRHIPTEVLRQPSWAGQILKCANAKASLPGYSKLSTKEWTGVIKPPKILNSIQVITWIICHRDKAKQTWSQLPYSWYFSGDKIFVIFMVDKQTEIFTHETVLHSLVFAHVLYHDHENFSTNWSKIHYSWKIYPLKNTRYTVCFYKEKGAA